MGNIQRHNGVVLRLLNRSDIRFACFFRHPVAGVVEDHPFEVWRRCKGWLDFKG